MPMPRLSTATIGLVFKTSAPARVSQTGSCTEVGMFQPVVTTSGPASGGVCEDRARTTPTVMVPDAVLIGSSSASKVAQSSFTLTGGGTDASENTRDVQSRHARSFFGFSTGGGPASGLRVTGLPCGPDPRSVAYFGSAAHPGAQPASTATVVAIAAPTRKDRAKRMVPRVATGHPDEPPARRAEVQAGGFASARW